MLIFVPWKMEMIAEARSSGMWRYLDKKRQGSMASQPFSLPQLNFPFFHYRFCMPVFVSAIQWIEKCQEDEKGRNLVDYRQKAGKEVLDIDSQKNE